jgi:hypothetical protein
MLQLYPATEPFLIIRPSHKENCGQGFDGDSRIITLMKSLIANPTLAGYLQLYALFEFDLLNHPSPDKPVCILLEVGIEPINITLLSQLLLGADIGTSVDGMLQVNAASRTQSTEQSLKVWQRAKSEIAAGSEPLAIAIVRVTKDSQNSIIFPLHIRDFIAEHGGREGEPVLRTSATALIRERPTASMPAPMHCIEYVCSLHLDLKYLH